MPHAPCKSLLSWEMFTTPYMTMFPQIPPFLSFGCSTLFSARSEQINLCYLLSLSNEVHMVNVKPEDYGLSEEIGMVDSIPEWRSMEARNLEVCEISQLPNSKCHWAYLLSVKRSCISSLLLQVTVAFLITYKCIQDPLCSPYSLTSVNHQIICQKISYPNSPLGIIMTPLIRNEMFTEQSETEIELKWKHPML